MSNTNPTQCQLILDYIAEFGSITPLEAIRDLGVYRLASRISEMKKKGFPITSKWEAVQTRRGTTSRIKRYSLMTDAEIIKALELCKQNTVCKGCPYIEKRCHIGLSSDALDLINRQKVENERLQKEIDDLEYHLDCECSTSADVGSMLIGEEKAKAEAIKEFAERLCKGRVSNDPVVIAVKVELEMAGDTE